MPPLIRAIWHYRHFIANSVAQEFMLRFQRSLIGALWGVLNPLAQVAIYALILSSVLQARIGTVDNQYSFALYLSAGMAGWSLFNDIVTKSLHVFVANADLIKKAPFPRIILIANLIGVCLLDHLLLLLAIAVLFVAAGHVPSVHVVFWLPCLAALVTLLATGVGLILGTLNVFLRDIGQITPIALQIAFWFTPIVYPLDIIPKTAQNLLAFNPLFPLIQSYQNVLVYKTQIPLSAVVAVLIFSVGILTLAGHLYGRAQEEMADVL